MKPTAITPVTPYLFIEIWVPKRIPYNGAGGWPCIVGDFVKPVMAALPTALVWTVQEGPFWQLCVAHPSRATAERVVRRVAKSTRFRIKRILHGKAGGGLAGTRWMTQRAIGTPVEGDRSILMLRAMDAICRLYVSTLVGIRQADKTVRWTTEVNADARQNPYGSLFESLMHLIANTTGARFTIHLLARTGWMDWAPAQVTANL